MEILIAVAMALSRPEVLGCTVESHVCVCLCEVQLVALVMKANCL